MTATQIVQPPTIAPHPPTSLDTLKRYSFLAIPVGAAVTIGVAGGLADHHIGGVAAALAGIAAIAAFDFAVASYASKLDFQADDVWRKAHPPDLSPGHLLDPVPQDPNAQANRKKRQTLMMVSWVAVPLALIAAGFAVHRYSSPEAGKLLMIGGGGALLANIYVLVGGPLPIGFSK